MFEQAKWISAREDWNPKKRYPASVFKKDFSVPDLGHIFLSVTAHGLYKIVLNGHIVGDYVLEPGPSEYGCDLPARVFDLREDVIIGRNVLEITVADGWYRGCNGINGTRNLFGRDQALLCQAENGQKQVLFASDEDWLSSLSGPVRFADTEQGETVDAGRVIEDWAPVVVQNFDKSCAHAETSPPVKEKERFKGTLIKTPNGETVIDFGQNLAGYTHFILNAHRGEKLILRHGETLDEAGNFTQKNFDPGVRNREGGITQKIEYTCREGLNDYKPSFAIFGFRYAKVETDIDLTDAFFEAIAVYSDMRETAHFECSDKRLNRLFLNSMWSMKSNFAHIPTDCPTRERAGWTGDAGLFAKTASLLMDSKEVYRYWLKQCRYLQTKDGKPANIAPRNKKQSLLSNFLNGSAGWGDGVVFAVYRFYKATHDLSLLTENYGMCKAWVEFERKRAGKVSLRDKLRKDRGSRYIVDSGFHFGEWCEPDISAADSIRKQDRKRIASLATAYYYCSCCMLSEMAEALGKDEAAQYRALAGEIKAAWREKMTVNGRIDSPRQADYVRPLAFGLLTGDEAAQAAKELNNLIAQNGYHLNTGFLSTPYLLQVLCRWGYRETAMELLFRDDFPSWLYAVDHGATTLWERWDAVRTDGSVYDSLNHYSYGSVSSFLLEGLAGINYEYGRLIIKPEVTDRLSFVSAEVVTAQGTVASSWQTRDGRTEFTFSVPDGPETELILPDGTSRKVNGGEYTVQL